MPRRLDSQTTESMKHTNNMPLMPVNAASIAQSNPWPMGPSLVGLSAAVNSKIVCSSKQWCCLNSTRTLYGGDIALQDTGTLAAAEYGRLALWEHSPLFSGLSAASIAAGRCISAGAPSRPLYARSVFVFDFSVCLSRVSCVCTPSSFSPKTLKSVPWL